MVGGHLEQPGAAFFLRSSGESGRTLPGVARGRLTSKRAMASSEVGMVCAQPGLGHGDVGRQGSNREVTVKTNLYWRTGS